ncbi:hypothetical protein ACFFK0_22840, partial [Paenibacillus chartarius]
QRFGALFMFLMRSTFEIQDYFYLEPVNQMSKYGNMTEQNYKKKNEIYFRCIVNFFKSSIYHNPNSKHYFICNETQHLNFIPDFDFIRFCNDNNIVIINKAPHYTKPTEKWAGSMYFFDSVDSIETQYLPSSSEDDLYLFFDNDVIINGDLSVYFQNKNEYQWFAYDISDEIRKKPSFHGVDLKQMNKKFTVIGGEAVGLRGKFITPFMNNFRTLYQKIDNFYTEEHYLSQILSVNLIDEYSGLYINDTCKRIWTNVSNNNVDENDKQLRILHLPSEKEYGLYWLSKHLLKNSGYSPDDVLKIIGIPKKTTSTKMRFYIKKISKRLEVR